MTGNLTWSVSDDCSALHVVGQTTRIVGILVTAVRETTDGLGWRGGLGDRFTPLTAMTAPRPGA